MKDKLDTILRRFQYRTLMDGYYPGDPVQVKNLNTAMDAILNLIENTNDTDKPESSLVDNFYSMPPKFRTKKVLQDMVDREVKKAIKEKLESFPVTGIVAIDGERVEVVKWGDIR